MYQVPSTKYQVLSTTGELVMVKMRMLGTTVARVEKQKSFTLCSQQRKQTTLPEDKPRRLIEGSVKAGQDIDKAVEDDQIVDSRSPLPENDLACPGVDHNSDHREDDVGVEVGTGLAHVYLRQHNKGWMERKKGKYLACVQLFQYSCSILFTPQKDKPHL